MLVEEVIVVAISGGVVGGQVVSTNLYKVRGTILQR